MQKKALLESGAPLRRPTTAVAEKAALLCVIAAFLVLYCVNLGAWAMHDDEGAAVYEAWQLQRGQAPGIDFIAENQPLFLLLGKTAISLAGRDLVPLRLLSLVPVLIAALVLANTIHRIWNDWIAVLAFGIILANGIVFEQARIYRPDATMLAWEMAALAAALSACHTGRRRWWFIAGVCYGASMLWKIFGLLPVFGLALFFADRLRRQWPSWRPIFLDGLTFSASFLAIATGVSLLLYGRLGYYYGEALAYHASMGATLNPFVHMGQVLFALFVFFVTNPVCVLLWPLWAINRRFPQTSTPEIRLLYWQFSAILAFVVVTRPPHTRYFLFLVPVIAILLARQIYTSVILISRSHLRLSGYLPIIVPMVLIGAILTASPRPLELAFRTDLDTHVLAAFVASQTEPNDTVLSDYAMINFLADRASIYDASIIAGAQISSRAVTTERLLSQIEARDVEVVLIHVAGGNPHHIVRLDDYSGFRRYLNEHFTMLTTFLRNDQQIEIYKRRQPAIP